jgi:hypothetical protein
VVRERERETEREKRALRIMTGMLNELVKGRLKMFVRQM